MSDGIQAVDLFAGAGGVSWGLVLAAEEMDADVELAAVNHWERAIETHERNHPWADHYHAKVEELAPGDVFEAPIDILTAGPECTHWSSARGSAPVDEQKRSSPWHVLDWVEKLRPENFLLENVPEIEKWGPVGEDGQPTRDGTIWSAWVDALHALGYSVEWQQLNAANHGDATTRKRLFVMGKRSGRPHWPEQSHSEDGTVEGTEPWRPAAEIIDWSDLGPSIWGRSRPLVNNTMQRIAEGIRRHGTEELQEYADIVANLGKEDVEALQEDIVTLDELDRALEDRDGPFLVRHEKRPVAADGGDAFLLGQQSGSRPRNVEEKPLPTIATRGAISLISPQTFVLPRNGFHRGLHSNATYDPESRPLHTVTAKNHDGHVVTPYLVQYYGNSDIAPIEAPLPTVTTRDRFALVVPEHSPWGLDIRFRMLQPRELAQAMGFPEGYDFAGNKTETVEQIGNAVPVNLAKSLVQALLEEAAPSLFSDSPAAKPGVATDGGEET